MIGDKAAFESIMAGLEDALAYARGDRSRGVAHEIEVPEVAVRGVRTRLGLSQSKFAAMFGSASRPSAIGSRAGGGPRVLRACC